MQNTVKGIILKGIGGFYYVETVGGVCECRARGLFRRQGITPLAGDSVLAALNADGTGTVEEILPRKNFLARPPVANIDQLAVVVSVCEPVPNTQVIDRMTAAAVHRGIEPFLVFSKADLQSTAPLEQIYRKTGLRLFCVSSVLGEGVDEVRKALSGKITAFAGNSGVGKSSLLNSIFSSLHLKTGEISQKLGRGRHTTRQVELLKLEGGGYVADTPGFSSFGQEQEEGIPVEDLPNCFPEFEPYLGCCRFTTCTHTCERGCAVLEAVQKGEISSSRHESYIAMYREMKDYRQWESKKRNV